MACYWTNACSSIMMEMKELMQNHATSLDRHSALALVLLSHGHHNDLIFGTDGEIKGRCHQGPGSAEEMETDEQRPQSIPVKGTFITLTDINKIYNSRDCPNLEGKPRLFIIQACRGVDEDIVYETVVRDTDLGEEISLDQSDVAEEHTAATADMCYVFATVPGYAAYRDAKTGSLFLEEFMDQIVASAHNKEIYKILREVMNHFSHEDYSRKTQVLMTMPEFTTRLTKSWYFNPSPLQQ